MALEGQDIDSDSEDVGIEIPPEESEESNSTALLPLNFFQGREFQPGEECRIKINRILDGQAEVIYLSGDEAPDIGEEPPSETDEELDGYMNA